MIRGIKFTGIPVHNQDASLKFYTEKLGFKVVTDQPFTVGILRRCRSHFRYCNRADPGERSRHLQANISLTNFLTNCNLMT